MCVKDAIAFAFLGLGAGSFFALMATGLVVAYKGSGVINFAHGSVAMYAAFTFNYLRIDGRLRLPWVDILPTHQVNLPVQITISSGGKVNVWLAVLLALAMSALLGVGMHYLVFRPLRNAAPLGKVIGAIGVMLYLQGVALVNFGSENPQPKSILLPDTLFKNFLGFGKPMPGENLGLFIMAVLVGAVLWFNYKYTRFGLATRAAAGNEKGAVLLGYSPERLALFNWIIAAMTAGLAGVFVGSITGALTPTKFTTLIVPALGAALIGSLSSVPIAIAGGVGIGMIQTVTSTWMTGKSWFPDWLQSGATDAIPLVIIVLTLFLRGKSLPIRGNIEERRLPLSPYPKRIGWHVAILVPLGVVLAYGLPGDFVFAGLSGKWSFAFMTSLIAAMLMLSYVLLAGYVGQISMVQLSIAGVSAFFMARMSANGVPSPADPWRPVGSGDDRGRGGSADSVLRQLEVDKSHGRLQRSRSSTDVLRCRRWFDGPSRIDGLSKVRDVLCHRLGGDVRHRFQSPAGKYGPTIPRGPRQRASSGVGWYRRCEDETSRLRNRVWSGWCSRCDDGVPAAADLVVELGLLRRPHRTRFCLPRRNHIGCRSSHRRNADRLGPDLSLRFAPVVGTAHVHASDRWRRNDPDRHHPSVGPGDAVPAPASVFRPVAEGRAGA
jgi:branched-subunit amino acid ABC-type transport system permease component